MAHLHDPRTVEVPATILAVARAALEAHGPRRGAELIGISRNALLGMVATGRAMPGTVALAEQKRRDNTADDVDAQSALDGKRSAP